MRYDLYIWDFLIPLACSGSGPRVSSQLDVPIEPLKGVTSADSSGTKLPSDIWAPPVSPGGWTQCVNLLVFTHILMTNLLPREEEYFMCWSRALNRGEDGILCPSADGSHTNCQPEIHRARGMAKRRGEIQAKVCSLQTDTCGIWVIKLLNGGGILLLTVGVWFCWWTTQIHTRPRGIFFSWQGAVWCFSSHGRERN